MGFKCVFAQEDAYKGVVIDGRPSEQFCRLLGPNRERPGMYTQHFHCLVDEGYRNCALARSVAPDAGASDFKPEDHFVPVPEEQRA